MNRTPQLADFVLGWAIATGMGALLVMIMASNPYDRLTAKKCLIIAALIVGFSAIAAAIAAGIYHAEWIDYRRAVAR